MHRILRVLITLGSLVWATAIATAAECHKTLPIEDRLLSEDEVRACIEPRAKALVALQLLGEQEVAWRDYGSITTKCTGGGQTFLSKDPVVWAAEVSTCPTPKDLCGCTATIGTQAFPDASRAPTMRDANMKLIQRVGALATRRAYQECAQVEAQLRSMSWVSLRRSCSQLSR